jgi:RNA polymerase sigma-70 factor (ECF subfamily)
VNASDDRLPEPLMELYVDGDERAFESLYELLRPILIGALRRWLDAEHKVNDAFQLTWLKVHASRMRYRRGAPVLPWILTIARNVAMDYLRSRASKERTLDERTAEQIEDAPLDWSSEDEAEVIEAVRSAVESLPASCREVIRLHKLEGRSMAEVAEILGIKEGAARVRAHRGYKALARVLSGWRQR